MILLARHGETDDNREPLRFQGHRDTVLNNAGRQQAAALAESLVGEGIRSLHCSDLARARESATIIGARLGLTETPDPRLREGFRGAWEGRLFADVEREDPEGFAAWRRAGEAFRFPDGESLREHAARVLVALGEIRALAEPPALVVCHGGSIRVVLCESDPRGLDAFHSFEIPNAAVVRV